MDIIHEYELTASVLDRWIVQSESTGSFKAAEELELEKLRKKVKQLQMKNDILKQAALILGRK